MIFQNVDYQEVAPQQLNVHFLSTPTYYTSFH
jgi:hypothetical protein